MTNQTMKRALVAAIAGATALGAVTPSWSAPMLSSTTAVKAAAPSALSDVRYGYHGYDRNRGVNGAAVALGILGIAGAVAASSAYRQRPYGYGAYDGGYGYGGGPYYGPANYGYRHGYRSW